jgi:hypothetical protein
LVFVEIDYLHETPPTYASISPYRKTSKDTENSLAYPYHIYVLDPREKYERGPAWVYSFAVDDPMPTVTIPLSGTDFVKFDFGIPYTKTFEDGFLGDEVDYSELPPHFDHYNQRDQTSIARRMLAVLQAASEGVDLEIGSFPVAEVDLETALKQIETYKV